MSVAVLSVAGTVPASAIDLADLDEPAVIDRAKAGDREAFGELYRRHQDIVLRVVRCRLRAYPSDVDDVASEVFLRAFSLIGTYEHRGRPFVVWLKQIARWRTVSHRSWRTHRREDALAPTEGSGMARLLAERSLNPEDEVILRLELRRLLGALPVRRRLALVLRDWAGWSYDDIARTLKISYRATDALVTNARKAVRESVRMEGRAMLAAKPAASPLPKPLRPIGRPLRLRELGEVSVGPKAPALPVRDVRADHEAQLICRAQAGDREAFGELYSRHQEHVHRFLGSRLRGREGDVDDLVAETFLAAMQRIGTFEVERPGAFGNWLIGIARNLLLRHLDRVAGRETALDDHAAERAGGEVVSPEDVALDRLEVADALARLAPRPRRALLLQHAVGMSCAEVALALGTSKRAVWTLVGHARSALRGEVRLCACGCGADIRPERWGRDRFATLACARRATAVNAAERVLCACGCGAELPEVRSHNRRYATAACRSRASWRRRQEEQRRCLAGPAAADPAVERVLAVVRAARNAGIGRNEIARRTRLLAARLDRALDLLAGRRSVAAFLVPDGGRLATRYCAVAAVDAGRAA